MLDNKNFTNKKHRVFRCFLLVNMPKAKIYS